VCQVSCPDPNATFEGEGCSTYGITCGGDPQLCGTTTVYDALLCQGGVWNVVASTACDIDGGPGIDAGSFEGGI